MADAVSLLRRLPLPPGLVRPDDTRDPKAAYGGLLQCMSSGTPADAALCRAYYTETLERASEVNVRDAVLTLANCKSESLVHLFRDPLYRIAQRPGGEARSYAFRSLLRHMGSEAELVPLVAAVLDDPLGRGRHSELRRDLLGSIGMAPEVARALAPTLSRIAGDRHEIPESRRWAARSLGDLPRDELNALPDIVLAARDALSSDQTLSIEAGAILAAAIGEPRGIPLVKRLLLIMRTPYAGPNMDPKNAAGERAAVRARTRPIVATALSFFPSASHRSVPALVPSAANHGAEAKTIRNALLSLLPHADPATRRQAIVDTVKAWEAEGVPPRVATLADYAGVEDSYAVPAMSALLREQIKMHRSIAVGAVPFITESEVMGLLTHWGSEALTLSGILQACQRRPGFRLPSEMYTDFCTHADAQVRTVVLSMADMVETEAVPQPMVSR